MSELSNEANLVNADLLPLIADSLPVLVSYIDADVKYVYLNKTYELWFQRPLTEMQGFALKDVLSPGIYEKVIPHIRRALGGEKTNYDVKVPSRFGGFRHIQGTYTPDFAPDGKVRGVISHIVDVTEKKAIEEALQQTQLKEQFLAEAGQRLSTNLDLQQIYATLSELLVPHYADWYGIELLNSDHELKTVTAYHQDPEKIPLAFEMRRRYPTVLKSSSRLAEVLRTGKSAFIEFMSDDFIRQISTSPEHAEMMRTLGFRSVIMAPLRIGGRVAGVLTCVKSDQLNKFEASDVSLMEGLAYRVGLAIENAQLYVETKRQKDRFYETLMRSPTAICIRRGPELVYEFVNEPYQKMVGESRKLLGRKFTEVFPNARPETLEILYRCAVHGERFSNPEYVILLDWDGTKRLSEKIVNMVCEPLLDANGKPEGVISFSFEVTDQVLARRKIEEAAENFRILTETIPHMVWTADANGATNYYNQRWYEYTGMKKGDLLGGQEAGFVHPEDLEKLAQCWRKAVASGSSFECEMRLKNSAHQYRWFMARALPVRDEKGTVEKWFGTCTEIQGQKELEENLIKARTGAERASLAKSNFLANMSHEIRTPMTAVLGFTELLSEPELTEADRADCLQRIERSGQSLLRLIDDILDISKIEAGQLHFEKYSFAPMEVVAEVIAMLKMQANQKSVKIKVAFESDIPERIISDATRVRQILINLLGNAVKFTSEGEITVALRFTKRGDRQLFSFEVRDTGIGISPDDQLKLFSAFVQADDSITRNFGGTGLGLVLSRRLAENLGEVWTSCTANLVKARSSALKLTAAVSKGCLGESKTPICLNKNIFMVPAKPRDPQKIS